MSMIIRIDEFWDRDFGREMMEYALNNLQVLLQQTMYFNHKIIYFRMYQ